MTLERWIAVVFLVVCLVYGYAAFFTMDTGLPPFMQRNPVWPSSFPKILSIIGVLLALFVLVGPRRPAEDESPEIDYRRLNDYHWGRTLALLGLMVAYALSLHPIGFLVSTSLFLILGGLILGERRWLPLVAVAAVTTGGVWYLVQEVLGIFLTPLPWFV